MGSTIGSPCSEEFRAHTGSLRTFGKKKANLGVLEGSNLLVNYSRLKADWTSCCMVVDREGEPDLCEECSYPLEDGFCRNCGGGFREGASPVGPAPLNRQELSSVLGRWVSPRTLGSYSLSMQQGGMAPLRKEIELLVEQFNASPELKNSVRQNSEKAAVKLLDALGPTKAAIASVAQEFLRLGRNMLEVSLCISRVHPQMGRLRDLVIEVYPTSSEVGVRINGRERKFDSHDDRPYCKLRIHLFAEDRNATLELKNARLTRNGYDDKRVKPLGPSKFVLIADERNFELFKLLKEAKLSGENFGGEIGAQTILRKYSISKLPVTEWLLREVHLLRPVSAEYARGFAEKVKDGHGRSPRKLAEEALFEACEHMLPPYLRAFVIQKYHLKESAMISLVVKRELEAWRG